MGNIAATVDNLYTNLLLVAISRNCNFAKLIHETDEETRAFIQAQNGRFLPDGYGGLYHMQLLSRKMGSSLGELYSFSKARKQAILQKIIDMLDPISKAYGRYYREKGSHIEFGGVLNVLDGPNPGAQAADLLKPDDRNERPGAYYYLTFCKNSDGDGGCVNYSISISGSESFSSNYVYDSYVVWAGQDGAPAEFIEKAIQDYRQTHIGKLEPYDSVKAAGVEKRMLEPSLIREEPEVLDDPVEKIAIYEGKLKRVTQNPVIPRFLIMETSKGNINLPVSYDAAERVIYIEAKCAQKHKQQIDSGNYKVMREPHG